jgi:hypothetical protein
LTYPAFKREGLTYGPYNIVGRSQSQVTSTMLDRDSKANAAGAMRALILNAPRSNFELRVVSNGQ